MNLLLRLVWLIATARLRKRIELLDECRLDLRVWPTDLDVNLHLTNARYLSMMDLGRIELILQMGVFKTLLKRGWLPVVANANIQFKRQIKPFQRFQLITRIIGWDEKWIFLEQRFETEKGTAAIGVIKSLFRSKKGNIPSSEILKLAGFQGDSPELPSDLLLLTGSSINNLQTKTNTQ